MPGIVVNSHNFGDVLSHTYMHLKTEEHVPPNAIHLSLSYVHCFLSKNGLMFAALFASQIRIL